MKFGWLRIWNRKFLAWSNHVKNIVDAMANILYFWVWDGSVRSCSNFVYVSIWRFCPWNLLVQPHRFTVIWKENSQGKIRWPDMLGHRIFPCPSFPHKDGQINPWVFLFCSPNRESHQSCIMLQDCHMVLHVQHEMLPSLCSGEDEMFPSLCHACQFNQS